LLVPAFLTLWGQANVDRFGKSLPDKLILGYMLLHMFLMLQVSTFTNTLRHGVFYAFIDIFLPYYVASRSPRTMSAFRDLLTSFAIAGLILAVIGIFEVTRHWLLYVPLLDALDVRWGYGNYMERGAGSGLLRAQGSTLEPIPLGYVMAVMVGLFPFFKKSIAKGWWTIGFLVLLAGLVSPLSRGPWLGAASILLVFIAFSPSALRTLAKYSALGLIVAPLVLMSPLGDSILDYLPFVGTVEAENVAYRQRLLEISMYVILDNPFFGAFDYIYSPAMQELKQAGQGGLIDIVNTYLGIALSSGLVGLSLFAGFFLAVVSQIVATLRKTSDRQAEHYPLGQSLLAALVGILVIIFTVSSITIIPVIYWSLAGLGVAYVRMVALRGTAHEPVSEPAGRALAYSRVR
jgi:O-antigen ligase